MLVQRVLSGVATAALLGLLGLAWTSYEKLQSLTTDIEVIKVQSLLQSGTLKEEIDRMRARMDRLEGWRGGQPQGGYPGLTP